MLQHNPLFLVYFCSLHPILCKSCVLLKTLENSVFSRTQLLWITDSKNPFRDPFQKTPFLKKMIFRFCCACWNPCFCSVLWFYTNKKRIIPQTDNVDEHASFAFPTQVVLCNFCHFWQDPLFFPPTQKHYSSGHVLQFSFLSFSSFLFVFLQHKKAKENKNLSENLIFDIPTILENTIFAPLLTIWDLQHAPKRHKTGENKQNKSWTRYWHSTWTRYWLKNPQKLKTWIIYWLYSKHVYVTHMCVGVHLLDFPLDCPPSCRG